MGGKGGEWKGKDERAGEWIDEWKVRRGREGGRGGWRSWISKPAHACVRACVRDWLWLGDAPVSPGMDLWPLDSGLITVGCSVMKVGFTILSSRKWPTSLSSRLQGQRDHTQLIRGVES